jgi:hypothetical protein
VSSLLMTALTLTTRRCQKRKESDVKTSCGTRQLCLLPPHITKLQKAVLTKPASEVQSAMGNGLWLQRGDRHATCGPVN